LGPRLAGATTRADIAILYDFTNEWAQGMGGVGDSHPRYTGEAMSFYNGFKILQLDIDVCSMAADYSQYKVIIASNLRLINDSTADCLRAFVAAGGTLVLNYRAGTQNTDNSMRRMLAPGPFTDIAGVKSEAMLDLNEYTPQNGSFDKDLEGAIGIGFAGEQATFTPRSIVESLVLHGADPIATVHGGRMAGQPVVTRNRYQKGWVFYVGVDCVEDEFYEVFARMAGGAAMLKPLIAAPYGIEVTSRQDANATYYFLVNLTEVTHDNIELPGSMNDLIHERNGVTSLSLGALDVAVLERPKKV
jgi:beta-galactosidase